MSLRTRIVLWNMTIILGAVLAFGTVQIWASHQSSIRLLDGGLLQQVTDFARRPRPIREGLQGPEGQGGPNMPEGRQNRMRLRMPPRFRMFDLEGAPLGPDPAYDSALLRKAISEGVSFGTVTMDGTDYRVISYRNNTPGRDAEVIQAAQEMTSLAIARRGQLWVLLVSLPVAVLASFGLARLLAKFVLKPVERLTQVAETIAADPAAQERIAVEGDDEMARLGGTFNSMTDRLQQALSETNEALERQKRFASDAAHELRTPLTGISLAAENGLHPDSTPDDMRKSLETILRSSGSMTRLTDVLLTLARLDRSGDQLACELIDLDKPCREAAEDANLSHDIRLKWEIEPGSTGWANPQATRQIVRNLLENAAAYTPADGAITIRVVTGEIVVVDSGPGISDEHLPHLFERFYRVDTSRTRANGGFGLGLAIVAGLAEAMGASVSVESELGVGSTFRVKFRT